MGFFGERKNGTGRVMILGAGQDISNADLQILRDARRVAGGIGAKTLSVLIISPHARKMRKKTTDVSGARLTQCTNRFRRPSRPIICTTRPAQPERVCLFSYIAAGVFIFTSAKINFCWWERSVITNTHSAAAAIGRKFQFSVRIHELCKLPLSCGS